MASYIGLQQQIRTNNRKSILLLAMFPILVLVMVFAVVFFMNFDEYGNPNLEDSMSMFIQAVPPTLVAVGIWFFIAYFSHSTMITMATHSKTLERKENMRVYNLVENLCMSVGMTMPKLYIIESDALNAFASGINKKTYAVTLTRGIINALNDDELEGVIAHELTHIRNRDVRLLIVTVVFVGIFSFIMQVAFRGLLYGGNFRSSNDNKNDKGGGVVIILVVLVASAIAYFLSFLFKMALSRKREYLADAGAVEMTRNPLALASALRKISGNSKVEDVKSKDVKSMFIDNSPSEDESMGLFGGVENLFSTHPPIMKRIQVLEQF